MVAATTALIVAGTAAAVGTGYSIHAGEMAKKKAKGVAEGEARMVGEQKKVETSKRKTLIKNMRANIGNGGYSLNKTSPSGLVPQASAEETLG